MMLAEKPDIFRLFIFLLSVFLLTFILLYGTIFVIYFQ